MRELMAKGRAKQNDTPPLRFDEKLVLNQWMLSLFEVNDFAKLAGRLKGRHGGWSNGSAESERHRDKLGGDVFFPGNACSE